MSTSFAQVDPDIRDINRTIRQYPNAVPVVTTNKRMVIRCTDGAIAYYLKRDLQADGFTDIDTKPGLKTSRYYVQVGFNRKY